MSNIEKSANNIQRKEFDEFIRAMGLEIEQAQVKLISAANSQMLLHYWKMGNFILYYQKQLGWGAKVIQQISKALHSIFPDKKGYSPRNLQYMCQFARLYPLEILENLLQADKELELPTVNKVLSTAKGLNEFESEQKPLTEVQSTDYKEKTITQQVVAQILPVEKTLSVITQQPVAQIEQLFLSSCVSRINWAGHVILMNHNLPLGIRYWYMQEAVQYGWSRNILDLQIKSGLFQRQIKENKVNNFSKILPDPQSDLANYLLKDPYLFDLAGAKDRVDERDIEEQLVNHVTKYLLEMGTGFAFVARQKHFQIGNSDFYADLILYNIKLHAYVVIELKSTPFKPEYAGQLNFYINVVDDKLRGEHDNKTIGLLLCKGKDEIMAQYALSGYNQAIGVSDYQLSKAIPENLKSALPTIEEVEEELTHLLEDKENEL
jgi:predicted nuclease of restriction endonuclease-like (RecB) superfamily